MSVVKEEGDGEDQSKRVGGMTRSVPGGGYFKCDFRAGGEMSSSDIRFPSHCSALSPSSPSLPFPFSPKEEVGEVDGGVE